MTQASAGAMHWSKPSENRFCERSAKAIGLSEALVERQLAWASRGRRWHTRWISWASLGLPSETVPNLCLLIGRVPASASSSPIAGAKLIDSRSVQKRLFTDLSGASEGIFEEN